MRHQRRHPARQLAHRAVGAATGTAQRPTRTSADADARDTRRIIESAIAEMRKVAETYFINVLNIKVYIVKNYAESRIKISIPQKYLSLCDVVPIEYSVGNNTLRAALRIM